MNKEDKNVDILKNLGIDVTKLHQDYYKIPLENVNLKKIENSLPKTSKVTSKHTLVIDSRQRDYVLYPNSNSYMVEPYFPHRSVERLELIAVMLPKTEYNINSENNLLLVNINGIQDICRLTPGQYVLGGNICGNPNYKSDGTEVNWGLLNEIKVKLRTIDTGFNVFLVTAPPPKGTGNNASVLNRICITHGSLPFSIDFRNINLNGNSFSSGSPFRILGFNKTIYDSQNGINKIYGSSNTGVCTSSQLLSETEHTITIHSIVSDYDYNLSDDPNYIIMQLEIDNNGTERVESADIATNQSFAVVLYDSNTPDTIQTYNSSSATDNVTLKVDRNPGLLKSLKGTDFDKKVVTFAPSTSIENIKVSFFKYDNTPYNFHNRENLLIFEIDVADHDSKYLY